MPKSSVLKRMVGSMGSPLVVISPGEELTISAAVLQSVSSVVVSLSLASHYPSGKHQQLLLKQQQHHHRPHQQSQRQLPRHHNQLHHKERHQCVIDTITR